MLLTNVLQVKCEQRFYKRSYMSWARVGRLVYVLSLVCLLGFINKSVALSNLPDWFTSRSTEPKTEADVKQQDTQVSMSTHLVASIHPIYLLLQDLTQGLEQYHQFDVSLLIPASQSPHHYQLKASDIQMLQQAQHVVWVGPMMETFLSKVLQSTNHKNNLHHTALINVPGIELRAGENFVTLHDEDVQLLARVGASDTDSHHDEESHEHDHIPLKIGDEMFKGDSHVWLSFHNIEVIAEYLQQRIAQTFAHHEPEKRQAILKQLAANTEAFVKQLKLQKQHLQKQLATYSDLKYWVFHDAYGYFEHEMGLKPSAVITPSLDKQTGIQHIVTLKQQLKKDDIRCLFVEPQLNEKIVSTLDPKGALVKVQIDPMGMQMVGEAFCRYCSFMGELGKSYQRCLGEK